MLIAYTPAAWGGTAPTVTIANATWLTSDGGSACVDGKPARKARYNAPGPTAPTVTLTFPAAISVRVVAIIGLAGVAAGAAVSVACGAANGAGVVTAMPDGTLGCFIVLPAGGAAAASAVFTLPTGTVDVGELVALPAVDIGIREGWGIATVDPTDVARTRGGARVGARRRSYRVLTAQLATRDTTAVRGGGADWETVIAALRGNTRAICIPQWISAGVVDTPNVQRTAIFGSASELPTITNVQKQWFEGASLTFEETPA